MKAATWVLAAVVLILGFLSFSLATLLDKSRLYPAAAERYDVESLKIGTLASVCPGLPAGPVVLAQVEICLAAATPTALRTLAIPTVDAVLDAPVPRFPDLLAEQGLEDLSRHLAAKAPYVLAVEIPAAHFREKALGVEPEVLVFHKITDAYFCIEGRCDQHANKNRYLAQTVPLLVDGAGARGATVTVWIVAHDPLGTVGLYLGSGLFVAKDTALGLARRFLPIAVHGLPVVFSLLFVLITAVGFGFAAVWRERFEFAAFAAYASALALNSFPTDYILGDFYFRLPLGVVDVFTFWKTALVPVAAASLALAMYGVRPRLILALAAVAQVFVLAVFGRIIPDAGFAFVSRTWIQTSLGAALLTLAIPVTVCALALRRDPRSVYLILATTFFATTGGQMTAAALRLFLGQIQGSSTPAPWSSLGLVALLAVLIHQTVAEGKARLAESRARLVVVTREAAVARTIQMLAHDARRPFSTLRMGVGYLRAATTTQELERRLGRVTQETDRALLKIEGMLQDVLETGAQRPLARERVAPLALVEAALVELVQLAPRAELEFRYDLRHVTDLEVDRAKVMRVFANILDNAVQAMRGHGTITIRTKNELAHVHFALENSGSFIPAELRAQIFDPYVTRGKAQGSGLGLAIAKQVVEAHGGEIGCESSEGRGTTFWFTLPRAEGAGSDVARVVLARSSAELRAVASFEPVRLDFEPAAMPVPKRPIEIQADA